MNRNLILSRAVKPFKTVVSRQPRKESYHVKPEAAQPDKPVIMLKRIGGTTYQVAVHFSKTSKETMNDKIIRIIRREAKSEAVNQ